MKIKLDENLPSALAEYLREQKIDTNTVMEEQLSGSQGARLLSVAQKERRILFTMETDFADTRTYGEAKFHLGNWREDSTWLRQPFTMW